ncbi:Retrovirus-related Pol polyprotein from transposon TNT 1-94 [Quillaja saponaria]|uniref:Retrovirus-related Pol polyprotein from transposon TNT 1-94 n=1 Tax=Quillaja saponaria TaxID=32244 RepID=A0AAD7LJR2_QUISA|nr:Retrovirus-related Pol polyprotein from transposon TNT 1-94 [Quillaja saponaria]
MSTYLGKIQNVKAEFVEILPLTTDLADQEAQRDKLFMILTLYGLRADIDPVRHQILASPSILSMEEVFARLLRISSPVVTHVENSSPDSSVLISHSSTRRGCGLGGRGRGHPQCTHCNRMSHIREKCYQLIGYPGTTTNIVQSANSLEVSPSKDKPLNVSLSATKYDKFLKYQVSQQSSHGNSVACLSQTSFDTWILDSGASDQISGIDQATPLSSLPLETESSFFPLTIPESPSISEALPVPYLGPNNCVSYAPLPDLPANIVDVPDDSPSVPTPSRASDPASSPILRRVQTWMRKVDLEQGQEELVELEPD